MATNENLDAINMKIWKQSALVSYLKAPTEPEFKDSIKFADVFADEWCVFLTNNYYELWNKLKRIGEVFLENV